MSNAIFLLRFYRIQQSTPTTIEEIGKITQIIDDVNELVATIATAAVSAPLPAARHRLDIDLRAVCGVSHLRRLCRPCPGSVSLIYEGWRIICLIERLFFEIIIFYCFFKILGKSG
jgi:hypothetical protein